MNQFKDGEVVYTQGDVLLKKLSALPEDAQLHTENTKILQQSETTGNHHQFTPDSMVNLYTVPVTDEVLVSRITPNGGKVIEVKKQSYLFHGKLFDHNPVKEGRGDHISIPVEPGIYSVDIVREFDYTTFEATRVVD
jgi:archaellum component FlaF (FlaF/FlaG flagellin family)